MRSIVVALALLCLAVPATASGAPPLMAFGPDGWEVPQPVLELLPEGFFERDLTRALADGQNYTAVIDVARELSKGERTVPNAPFGEGSEPIGGTRSPTLVLENPTEEINDVVVALPVLGERPARNYLVRLEPGATRRIDLSATEGHPSLYLVALGEFSARLELADSVGARSVPAPVLAPITVDRGNGPSKSFLVPCRLLTHGCGECEETISICAGSTCVRALARRTEWGSSGKYPLYKVDVHYPVAGPVFHCHRSTLAHPYLPCQGLRNRTFEAGWGGTCGSPSPTAKQHSWNHLDGTLLYGIGSTVSCTLGCSQTWGVIR